MCRLACLLDSTLWHRKLGLMAGGSCQVSVESACLSFCSGLSSGNASARADFIWSNVWCTRMSQDLLNSCWGCLRWLHFFFDNVHMCFREKLSGWLPALPGLWLIVGGLGGPSTGPDTSLLASHLYVSGHMGEWKSLMGSPPGQAPNTGAISSPDMARQQKPEKIPVTCRSLHTGGIQAQSWSHLTEYGRFSVIADTLGTATYWANGKKIIQGS